MPDQHRLLHTSRLVIRVALAANRVFLVGVGAGLLMALAEPATIAGLLLQPGPHANAAFTVAALRLLLLIGVVMGAATDRLLASLRAMVATAQAGDPFVPDNARRLQTIGWSLLVLQLLDVAAMLLGRVFQSLGTAAPDGQISIGGWVAVLMVFVLSRIFAAGAAMRDELEATV